MDEIKERAKEYAKNQLWGIALEDDEYEQRYNSIVELYLEIATEQKQIDIENVWEFLEERLMYVPEEDNPHVEGTKIESLKEFFCDLRKAIEE